MQENITHRGSGHIEAWQSEGKHPIAQHRRLPGQMDHQHRHDERNGESCDEYRRAYFITISTEQNQEFLGAHMGNQVRLSELGCLAHRSWSTITDRAPNITRDKFIVMPNHIHAALWCSEAADHNLMYVQPQHAHPQIISLVDDFKSFLTDFLHDEFGFTPFTVWQDEIELQAINTEQALEVTRRYILQNPQRWHMDHQNCNAEGMDPLFAQLRKELGIRDTVQREVHRQPVH